MQEDKEMEKEFMQAEQEQAPDMQEQEAGGARPDSTGDAAATPSEPADEEAADGSAAGEAGPEASAETKNGKKDLKDIQIEELKDKVIRQMAEFDNYRKRTDREKAQNYDIGASDFITKILPIVDNFERGLEALSDEERESSYAKGFDMIYKQLKKVLDDAGVVEIEAEGKPFDPLFHNAVMQQPSQDHESGTIIQVYRKGYMYKDRVLRHSMVIVAE